MKKRTAIVWVVIHCEYMPRGDKAGRLLPRIDEMVFHVSSSLRAAERYMPVLHVSEHSWWKIERRVIDEPDLDADDLPERHFYNYRGKPRAKEPHAAALRAFQKWQAEEVRRQRS